jgi:outer membrane lipase/esterase
LRIVLGSSRRRSPVTRAIRRSLLAAAAVAAALAASAPADAQYTNAYFFGDSLSDAGSFKPVLPPGTGLFTTNPGPVWVTPFAEHYGHTASPSDQGGNDYAYGGARVTQVPGYPASPPTAAAVPIATQISQFIAAGPVDRGATYSLWGGADDIFTQLTAVLSGQITVGQAQGNIALAGTQLAQQVSVLQHAGANYIVVWNVPDIGTTPYGRGSGQAALLTQASEFFNSALGAGLDAAGGNVLRLNSFALLNEAIANPAAFGFTNATTPACGATPSLLCTSANLVAPDAAQTYVFADSVHPTTAAQAIEAQYAISALNAPRAQGKLEAWAAYDYSAPDYSSGFMSGSGDVNTIAVGGDMTLSQRLLAGIMFNYSENKSDYGGMGFKLREPMGTVYVGYGDAPWYLGASAGGGSLDFGTTRDITLGALTRTESGTAKGWQFVGRLVGGYWFKAGEWVHGPTIRLTYQEIRVNQFSESGSDSTTMTFGQQERTSFVTSLGWQVAGQLGAVRPFARASWEYEGQADNRDVTASVYGMGGVFSIPAYKPDNSWGLFDLGVSTDFGKVTGYLTGSATAGKGDGDYYAVTVGLRVPL